MHFCTDYLKLRAVWKSVVTLVKRYFRKFSCNHLCPHLVYFATFEPVKISLEFSLGGLQNTGVQRLHPSRCDTHKSDFQMSHLLNKTCLSLHNGTTKPKKKEDPCSRLKSRKTFCCCFFCCCCSFYCFLFTVSISSSCLLPLCSWGEAGCYLFTLTPPLPSPSRSRICNDLLMSLKDALCGSLLYSLIWWTFEESRRVPRSEREARGSSSPPGTKMCFSGLLTCKCRNKKIEQWKQRFRVRRYRPTEQPV